MIPAVRPVAVPVAFVRTTAEGVPRAGVVSTGDVKVLFVRVWVAPSMTTFPVVRGKVAVVEPGVPWTLTSVTPVPV